MAFIGAFIRPSPGISTGSLKMSLFNYIPVKHGKQAEFRAPDYILFVLLSFLLEKEHYQ